MKGSREWKKRGLVQQRRKKLRDERKRGQIQILLIYCIPITPYNDLYRRPLPGPQPSNSAQHIAAFVIQISSIIATTITWSVVLNGPPAQKYLRALANTLLEETLCMNGEENNNNDITDIYAARLNLVVPLDFFMTELRNKTTLAYVCTIFLKYF